MKRTFSLFFALGTCFLTVFGATTNVTPGSGTLQNAVNSASAGDVLVLSTGTYTETSVKPMVAITIKAADGAKPVIKMSSRFEVKADFTLDGVTLHSTAEAVRMVPGNAVYNVIVKNCELSGCPNYFIRAYNTDQTTPYVDKLTVENCIFQMPEGKNLRTDSMVASRAIAATKTPLQLKSLLIKKSTFIGEGIGTGRFVYLHSGDENNAIALQGSVEIDHCTFYNSGDKRGVYPANIDGAHITNCIFMNPVEYEGVVSYAVYGTNSYVHNCIGYNAPVKVGTGGSQANCSVRNPYFVDAQNGNFQLYSNSPAVNAGTDGTTIGDPRWGVSSQAHENTDDPYVPYKMPYSMAPTTNSVKVLWQMNDETEATEALVYYGTDSTNLNQQISTNSGWNVADEGYVHVVTLTGLQPNTRYYFTVGQNATRRYPKISWTKTAPEAGTAYRIFSISDIHGNARQNWANMQDFICNLNCDIALMNGDFVSSKGDDRNWNSYYFTPGQKFLGQVPCMSSPGNHETGDPFTYRWSSFYDYFHQFSHEGASEGDTIDPRGESYFHFVYGNMDVVVLNLNGDPSSPNFLPGSKQYHWADSILNACTKPWIIICHHVGVHTTGYHGQWADEPRQMGTLFEKYAKAPYNKHIISLSGDDHSFEHLYKDGVHYLRPGCGRDSNYPQQKQLTDYQYSMFYRQVSCFSTLDMAADASKITLQAYDSVGNPFYSYEFLLNGEVITPSVNFTVPSKEVDVEDSIRLQWFTFDPNKDAVVSLYYSQNGSATSVTGMTPIVENLANTVDRYVWHTRNITPKGKYYVYAAIQSSGNTYLSSNKAVINLLEDQTPPPAPTAMTGMVSNGHYLLSWQNPTHAVHLDSLLTDFSDGVGKMQVAEESGQSTMALSVSDGALKCDYRIINAWATAAAEYVFDVATDMHQTPTLSFRLKGNGTNTDLRIVCKNMSGGHEDWWYTEKFSLSSSSWQTLELDMRTLQKFDWYSNTDDKNQLEGLLRISFGVSTENATSGTFYLDDLHLSGDINPAPDYAQTVIVRKDNAFPQSVTDGTEIYRGTAEQCIDQTSTASQLYYYAAFAADDRDNWSAPAASAQWFSGNTGIDQIAQDETNVRKIIIDGVMYIEKNGTRYNALGMECIVP